MAVDPFGLSPEEAIRFFAQKGFAIGFDWRDVEKAQHARAFTVAKATQLDVLAAIREAVDKSIRSGGTLADFRKSIKPTLQEKGWWGEKEVPELDAQGKPTGETKVVQLGSASRLRTIYETNLRTAQATGRWERFERTKQARPFARYVCLLDGRERAEHRAWHGTVLPIDHPWWSTHAPPNGWGCRCKMQQLSQRDVDRFGYQVDSHAPPVEMRAWKNERTGQTLMVPKGIDPGFDFNPGKEPRRFVPLDNAKPETSPDFGAAGRPKADELEAASFALAQPLAAKSQTEVLEKLSTLLGGPSLDVADPTGMQITLSQTALLEVMKKGGSKVGALAPIAKQSIEKPTEIWLQPMKLADGTVKMRLLYVGPVDDTGNALVVQRTDSGHAMWSKPMSGPELDAFRRGELLYPRRPA